MPRQRWTDDDSRRLRELHAQGKSLHSIAETLGYSKGTIGTWSRKLGLSWERERTAAAAEAGHVDNRALRVQIERRMLEATLREVDALSEQARVYAFGGADNHYAEEWLERPPPQDRKAIASALSQLTTAANRLHELNAAREADAAKSTLSKLREALTRQAEDDGHHD